MSHDHSAESASIPLSGRRVSVTGNVVSRCALLVAALLACAPAPVAAQNYRFQVTEMDLQVYVQPDASARLEYKIVFNNQPGARPIDVVDIGLPHAKYSIESMSASLDELPLPTIRPSEYIDVGVEVPLGGQAVQAGATGTLRFTCTMPDMVYQDTTDRELASLQMIPTWFDPQLQVGNTHLRIAVHLPASVQPDELKYHREETRYHDRYLFGEGDEKHVVAVWDWPGHRLSSNNPKIGISFPKRDMQRVVSMNSFQLLAKWFREHPRVQIGSGVVMGLLFLVMFFRFSHGTGCVLGILGVGLLLVVIGASPELHLILWPAVIGLCGLNEWALQKRRSKYLPAMATVEGGGIKRGLTAPEAAALLELPLGKIVTLVVFGMLKKGLLRVVKDDPLTIAVNESYRVSRTKRRKQAAREGIVIHAYEHRFLDEIKADSTAVSLVNFNAPLKSLIKATANRMKGFDLSDSRDYYRRIVARAWAEAESIGEIEQQQQVVDKNLEWMMMEPDWRDRFHTWHHHGRSYHPDWSRSGSTPAAGASAPAAAQPPTAKTSLGEVASSFAGWAENTSARLVGTIEPASLGLTPKGGIVDLGAVDKATADFFEAVAEASQSSGGGGGGGGCACACAGCACACACAGGGR